MYKKIYVEAGALNGICGSRSLSLSNDINYFGILVEPTPSSYAECVTNRKNEHTAIYNCALVSFDYKDAVIEMLNSTTHPGMNTCTASDITNLI